MYVYWAGGTDHTLNHTVTKQNLTKTGCQVVWSLKISEWYHVIMQFVWCKWPAVLIKPKSFHTNQISSVSSVTLLLMHQWSSQFVLYLMVGLVVQLCIIGCRKCWSYAAVLRCAVILRVSLALPLLRLFRRPRTVAFRPLLSETSKLRRKDSER